jgi:catechol 2,3-dioxygenase-like lactoylglutathione lyase family enzyme
MLDHAAVYVTDFDRSKQFFAGALEPLGYSIVAEGDGFAAFADATGFDFAMFRRDPAGGAHVAFKCDDRPTVDAVYAAAIAAGGTDNGAPGIRAHYDENYYAAFVRDPDGNNIEAVCKKPA